jgi:hypothetical protein
MSTVEMDQLGWVLLNHGGLLVDAPRLRQLAADAPDPLNDRTADEWRRQFIAFHEDRARTGDWVSWVLERVCGFTPGTGTWQRGSQIGTDWSRTSLTGEVVRPRQLWRGSPAGVLPVFVDDEHPQLGKGRGRKAVSNVLHWMRASNTRLALLTNGRQWRLLHAGLDADAFCEWDAERWFEEGGLGLQVNSLRLLLRPALWTQPAADQPCPLLQAVQDSRKGQAELSALLGERVREAVELLVQAHGEQLKAQCADVDPADIYRAAVRVVMRMVVVFFAESRDLLPRSSSLYHRAYGLNGLLEELEKHGGRNGERLASAYGAWPRILALFRLVHAGSPHPALPIHAYGGELFEAGEQEHADGLKRALAVFESACYQHQVMSDRDVRNLLERISRTKVKVRQGRGATLMPAPVDFSDLSSEYIGILYEGLLDFELKTAPDGDPVIFLAVGNEPALPLSRLEGMNDAQLKSLLEKMKDTSKKGDGDNAEDDADGEDEAETSEDAPVASTHRVDSEAADEDAPETDTPDDEEPTAEDPTDQRHSTRTRAETWARRVVQVAGLVKKPKGTLTPEKRTTHERDIAQKAKALVRRVVLPGEWFLVRWGGTRKGAGTFYTRPGLAVPTVHRTLRPLAFDAPLGADGQPDTLTPAVQWTPKKPEQILALKVCDPAGGSGSFPVATLRFLTDALYTSLHYHGRINVQDDIAIKLLLSTDGASQERLGDELKPCRPDDETFEARLKARLRRYVVERCIYAVDLDPLAVELCRLALWVETMDRDLPFSFLDHKIKCGNGLVGAWFDQFQHYPVMAWKNRDGGDKNHSNGVHFQKDLRGKAFQTFGSKQVATDLRRLLEGPTLFSEDLLAQASVVHDNALAALLRLHDLPISDSAERARLYREELGGSPAFKSLKTAMDLWCACWFWPADELEDAPLPTTLADPSPATRALVARIASVNRFFHWELEFPDVFRDRNSGFDAMLGNPPWDIAKPNSKEFFSNLDPLYSGLDNSEARQKELFADIAIEQKWLDYCERFAAWSNFVRYASNPFGDPEREEGAKNKFPIDRGKANERLHSIWRAERSRANGFGDPVHPFQSQGGSDLNLYKLFLEQMVRLLRPDGSLGVVLPASIYNDNGAAPLRRLLLTQCDLQWLFSFENRSMIFPIDSRFRFCCLVARRGKQTRSVRTAFGRRDLSDWDEAERFVIEVASEELNLFSPISSSIPEVDSVHDLDILKTLFEHGTVLSSPDATAWGLKYYREYDMTQARKAGQYLAVDRVLPAGVRSGPGHWTLGGKSFVAFYTGKMVAAFDFAFQRWVSGHAARATWEPLEFVGKDWHPEFVAPLNEVKHKWKGGTRLVFRDITNSTNERTMIASVIPAWPCGNKVPLIAEEGQVSIARQLALCCVLNSFSYDFVVRNRITGINLNKFIIDETPVPDLASAPVELSVIGARLCMVHDIFAGPWLELLNACPLLGERSWQEHWAIEPADRLELRAISEAIVAHLYGLNEQQFRWLLRNCDHPKEQLAVPAFRNQLPAKGFWRTGIGSAEHPWRQAWTCNPEFRLTNLAIVAYIELGRLKASMAGDLVSAIRTFAPSSGRNGWRLPDRLRLADYGLGQDRHAKEEQHLGLFLRSEIVNRATRDFRSWEECKRLDEKFRKL